MRAKKPKKSPTPTRFMQFGFVTVHEAREFVGAHRADAYGVICPCCDQLVKVYNRRLNAAMAVVLVYLRHHVIATGKNEWLHVPSFIRRLPVAPEFPVGNGGDWSKMRFWGLIEPAGADREDGSKRNGYYRITELGMKFVEGDVSVPEAVYVTNQAVLGRATKLINIHQALGERFNYGELMAAVPPPVH